MTSFAPPMPSRGLGDRPCGVATARGVVDPVHVLTAYTLVLVLIPGRFVVGPVGAVGTPALLLGMACALWWFGARLSPALGSAAGVHPVKVAVFVYGWITLLSYAVGHMRPLTALEASGADRAALTLLGLGGVALLAGDGIPDRSRLEILSRRLVAATAGMASIGIAQFFTGVDPWQYLSVPGLTLNHGLVGVASRSVFNRPYGTALHPIEYGVVLGAMLPLALHLAMMSATRGRRRWRAWAAVWIIAAGIPMSISRSGIVAVTAGLAAVVGGWSWRRRGNALVAGVMFTAVMWAAVPGLIGTVRGLFVGLDSDPSIQARTDRIPRIAELFSERPWLGRGVGTFSVEDYFLVDNEWYVTAIETGLIGVAVVVGLILTGILAARRAGRQFGDEDGRGLGYAIAAGLFALLMSVGTFDAFFYPIFTGVLFLLLGFAGALWRLAKVRGHGHG